MQEKLKINIAIINNGFLGMVRQWQEFFYERNYEATPLLNPNFVKLAEAYGIRSMAVTERSQVVPTVRAAREHDGAGADRLQGRAGRHGLSDGCGGSVVERHDPAAQSDRRNRRGRIR